MTNKKAIEYTIYFAGPLFDHKDLLGNAVLAEYIRKSSNGKYRCILPQNLEQSTCESVDVRNQDLSYVMQCDIAIFNFDGPELDSGTVVEFIYAKGLDIPSLVIRSDFRMGGDQDKNGDQWNLMVSHYPRTRSLNINAMEWYQSNLRDSSFDEGIFETINRFYLKFSERIINELDHVISELPILTIDGGHAYEAYRWALKFPGGELSDSKYTPCINALIESKRLKGLIS